MRKMRWGWWRWLGFSHIPCHMICLLAFYPSVHIFKTVHWVFIYCIKMRESGILEFKFISLSSRMSAFTVQHGVYLKVSLCLCPVSVFMGQCTFNVGMGLTFLFKTWREVNNQMNCILQGDYKQTSHPPIILFSLGDWGSVGWSFVLR